MIDAESAIFAQVAAAFQQAYPQGLCRNERRGAPEQFPCLTLVEEDNSTYEKSRDGSPAERHAVITYTCDVYSNQAEGARQQCKDIMALADGRMRQMGFARLSCGPAAQTDTTICQMTAKYKGVISEDFRIYRK